MTDAARARVILLADDDSDDQLLVKDAIADCGWQGELHFVDNGEQLLDYLLRRGKYGKGETAPTPGLILLDLNMPKRDGREALRQIRADASLRRIPVVVLTTSKADTDIGQLYDLGANSFVSKPVDFHSLVQVMRSLGDYWFKTVQLPVQK
jgi:CheY-like chemotaxis protein